MNHEDWFDRFGGVVHIDRNLHRCAIPVKPRHFDALEEAGIRVVFSLEELVPGKELEARGFDWRPHFWTDDMPPTEDQVATFLDDLATVPEETPVVVHCRAGWGRAGSAITCALVAKHGWPVERALSHFWSRVPDAKPVMVRNRQAEFVRGFAARRAGRGIP